MSEYQYYEFRAIDRPLDQRAMAALRAITSRGRITSTSLVNEYHFGDFKGNPDQLMDKYFDAHLYFANWGTRRLMLRFPAQSFSLNSAEPYTNPYLLKARATKEHVILDFQSKSEDGDDYSEEDEDWLASLIPLRADLLAGDLRCLYLGWLAGVQMGEVDESTIEPPVPPGLRQLTAPLRSFMEFIRLDPDLVEVAAAGSSEDRASCLTGQELANWIAKLSRRDLEQFLLRLMQGECLLLPSELLKRFREDRAGEQTRTGGKDLPGRTAGSMLEARDRLEEEKRRKAAEQAAKDQARRAQEQAEKRARQLDALAGQEPKLWEQVETAIKLKLPKEYDKAVELLKDLCDLGKRADTWNEFVGKIRKLRERHHSKRTLMQRMNRVGLPK